MDAVFGASATLIPWFIAALAAMLTLWAVLSALAATKLARAAAQDAERAAGGLIQLQREAERLHAAWRADMAALARLRSDAAPPSQVPQHAQAPQQAAPPRQPQPARPAPRPPLVANKTPEALEYRTVTIGAWLPASDATTKLVEAGDDEVKGSETTLMFGPKLSPVEAKDQFHGLPLLRVTVGSDPGKEFKLPFQACTVGRAGTNRVVLSENKASRVHAEIRFDHNRFFLKDLDSTNGTLRNGAAVTDEALEFGDIITIGKTELLFTCEGFDLKDSEPSRAIAAFARLLEKEPDFIPALHNLAFLLERDVARRSEADGVWKRLKRLEP